MDQEIFDALAALPNVTVTWKAPTREDLGHYRVVVEGARSAIQVIPCVYSGSILVVPSITTLKKLPQLVEIKAKDIALAKITQVTKDSIDRMILAYPPRANKGPSVQQVMNYVYYGVPLK